MRSAFPMAVACLATLACGAPQERTPPDAPDDAPRGGEEEANPDAPEASPDAPVAQSEPTPTSQPTCVDLASAGGQPVDLGRVPRERLRTTRVGPVPNAVGFSTDGRHVVYVHPGVGDRGTTQACGGRFLGSMPIAVDVRTRRCKLVRAGAYVDRATPVPILAGDVQVTQVAPEVAFALGLVTRPRDARAAPPTCVEVDSEAEPSATYGPRTESDRYVAFTRADAGAAGVRTIHLGDLEAGTVRVIGRASDVAAINFHAVGDQERFLMVVRSTSPASGGLFDVDAETGAIVRLGAPDPEMGPITVSHDGSRVAFGTGVLPGPPPRPASPEPRDDGVDLGRERLGCDPVGYPPGGCGWLSDGCGGYTYQGDCPELLRARARALGGTALEIATLPER